MIKNISEANIKLLDQMRIKIDMMIDEIENIAFSNSRDWDVRFFSQNHFTKDVVKFNRLRERIESVRGPRSYIDSIYVHFDGYEYILVCPYNNINGLYHCKDFYDKSWYDIYMQGNTYGIYLRESTQNELSRYISFFFPIFDTSYFVKGVTVVNISTETIKQLIREIKSTVLGKVVIIGCGNQIVYSELERNFYIDRPYAQELISSSHNGFIMKKKGKNKEVVSFVNSRESGWKYVSIAPLSEIIGETKLLIFTTFLVTLAVVFVAVLFSFLYSRYLYKPIGSLLTTIRRSIPEKNYQSDEFQVIDEAFSSVLKTKNNLEYFVDNNRELLKDKVLNNIILGHEYPKDGLEEVLSYFDIELPDRYYQVLLISDEKLVIDSGTGLSNSLASRHFHLISLSEDLLSKHSLSGVVFETNYQNIAVVLQYDTVSHRNIRHSIAEYSRDLQNIVSQHLPFSVSVGVGDFVEGLKNIYISYQNAKKALDHRIVLGRNKIIFSEDFFCENGYILQIKNFEKKVTNFIRNRDLEAILTLVDDIVQEVRSNQSLSVEIVSSFFIRLISLAMATLESMDVEVYKKFSEKGLYKDFMKNSTLDAINRWLDDFFKEVIRSLTDRMDNSTFGHGKVAEVEKYILNNYNHEELTLSLAAEKVGLNAAYLSSIFKEDTGKNFHDYLNMLRIEKSKEIMFHDNLPLYQIARLVGFNNKQSFTRYFRKYEGYTPGRYRESFLRKI